MSRLTKLRHPAYHLRPNKAVDRFLFLEVIRALNLYCDLGRHTYISLAGPFLEDVRVLAHEFPELRFVTVESDEETHKRQMFHRCSRKISFHHREFGDFLATDFPLGPTITWADYTDMTRECLSEISDIARKATPLSLIRITVNAETPVYHELSIRWGQKTLPRSQKRQFEVFLQNFQEKYAMEYVAYDDSLFTWSFFQKEKYPTLLMNMLETVIKVSCSHPKQFMPLHAAMYSDGTVMLSFTGLFCDANERDKLLKHFEAEKLLSSGEPVTVERIDVPALTTKERLLLEPLLPSTDQSGKSCLKELGYLIEGDGSEKLSAYKMQQYEQHYRFYPFFGKLVP